MRQCRIYNGNETVISSHLFIQLDAQLECSKGMLNFTLKFAQKMLLTCFGLTTIIRELTICTLLTL
jgi:hypothetical protein